MSGGIGVKTGKRWIWCGLERSDDTAIVFSPQHAKGLALTAWGPQAPNRAKEAAGGTPIVPSYPLASGAKSDTRTAATIAWERAWEKEKAGRASKRLLPVPTRKVLEFWNSQRKASTSIMMQFRLNIIGRNRWSAYYKNLNLICIDQDGAYYRVTRQRRFLHLLTSFN